MVRSIKDDVISGKIAKDVLLEMFNTKKDPDKIIEEKGLKQVTDISQIQNIVQEVINENQKMVEQYLSGKDKLLGFFVGQAMKKSKGKANPKILNEILKEKLSKKKLILKKKLYKIGKEKLLKIRDQKLDRRFVMLVLKDNTPGKPLLLHEEPIYLDDKIIGKTTSGNFSFNYNKNLSFGYVNCELSNEKLIDKNLYIEIEKKKYPAKLLEKPLKHNNFKNI